MLTEQLWLHIDHIKILKSSAYKRNTDPFCRLFVDFSRSYPSFRKQVLKFKKKQKHVEVWSLEPKTVCQPFVNIWVTFQKLA